MRSVPALASLLLACAVACGGDTGDPKVGECEDYCALIAKHCTGTEAQYGDVASCLATCEAMPLGDAATHTGNTIACRTFEAAAAELDPVATCPGAGPGGAGTCGTDCESFCATAEELCPDIYASQSACQAACAAFVSTPPFDASDVGFDTRQCRIYHLTAASVNPTFHCPHIAPVSSACVNP